MELYISFPLGQFGADKTPTTAPCEKEQNTLAYFKMATFLKKFFL
jgi:hypothetical protein